AGVHYGSKGRGHGALALRCGNPGAAVRDHAVRDRHPAIPDHRAHLPYLVLNRRIPAAGWSHWLNALSAAPLGGVGTAGGEVVVENFGSLGLRGKPRRDPRRTAVGM